MNNGNAAVNITCDSTCFAASNITGGAHGLGVRDLIAHKDLGVIRAPFSVTVSVAGGGDAGALLLTPV